MAESGAGSRLVDSQGKPLGAAPVGGVPVGSAMSDSFSFNMKGLKDLEGQIQTLITKFDTLDKKIQSVNGSLGKSGGAMGPSSPNLTISSFSNTASPVNQKLAQFGGTASGYPQGPGGPGNTTAPVSAFGGGTALKWAVGGELAASAGGWINTQANQLKGGYTGLQAQAAQSGSITGTGLTTTSAAFTGVRNMGPQDLGSAISALQQNPYVASSLGRSGKNMNSIAGFLNASQGLAPTQGAQGAAGFLNSLLSPQATQFIQNRTGGRGGIYNPSTGQFRNPQTALDSIIAAASGNAGLTGNAMSSRFKSILQNPGALASLQANLTTSPLGPGISSQYMPQIEQLLAHGGNLQQAQQAISGTTASTMLSRTTAGTQTGLGALNAITPVLNKFNDLATSMQHFQHSVTTTFPGLTNLAGGLAKLSSVTLQAVSALAMIAAAKSISGGGSGLLGGLLGRGGGGPPPPGGGGGGIFGKALNFVKGLPGKLARSASSIPGEIASGDEGAALLSAGAVAADTVEGGAVLASVGDPIGTGGMMPNLAMGINAMRRANPNIRINSGYRSSSQQAALYAAKGGVGVARPGQSPHQLGKAADIGPSSQYGWIAANAPKYGLAADKSEPWHVQAMGDPNTGSTVTGAQVLSIASTQTGVPYSWGGGTTAGPGYGTQQGANTKGFDCSHFVQYVFNQVGINLPPPSQSQAQQGKPVASLNQAQAGDLLFFNYEGPNSHVGIYIGGGKMIDAPMTGQTIGIHSVDTGHLDAIRRVIGGGAGSAVVAAAQQSVGSPSNDSHAVSGGGGGTGATGLANTFVSQMSNGGWLGGGGGGTSGLGSGSSGPTSAGGGAGGAAASSSATTSTATSNVSIPSSGTLTPTQVQAAWIKAGGPAGVAKTMAGIAMAESRDQPGIIQKGQPYSTTGWGLWQITPGNSEPQIGTDNALLNPVTNAKAALAKYQGAGNTLRPWQGDGYMRSNNINPNSSGVGDPGAFSPNVPGMAAGGPAGVSGMGRRGGGGINVNLGPIYVQGSQADANNIANMISAAIKSNSDLQAVANT